MKVFCPNCEKEMECNLPIEVYTCSECNEDFADYENPQITRLTARVRELEDANRWIPVTERNPKHFEFYQVVIASGNSKKTGRGTIPYSNKTGWDNNYGQVIFWRENLPLPDVPQEGE